jgi:hypothetical protein
VDSAIGSSSDALTDAASPSARTLRTLKPTRSEIASVEGEPGVDRLDGFTGERARTRR